MGYTLNMEEKDNQNKKSIVVLFLVIFFIGISAIVPASWFGVHSSKKITSPVIDLASIHSVEEVATDSNNDGIITWKEVMTDTLKADDVTIKKLQEIPVDKKIIAELNDPNNLTSSFSKNLYLSSAYLEKNGVALDQKTKDDLINKLILEEKNKIIKTVYTYKDINVAKTETKVSIKEYGNTVGPFLQNTINQKVGLTDIVSINSYIKTKKESDLANLAENRKKLDITIKKLLTISVPPSATIYHLIALNKIKEYRDVVDSISKADADPLRATLVITDYMNTAFEAAKALGELSYYFTIQNIVFYSKDSGYLFTSSYSKK